MNASLIIASDEDTKRYENDGSYSGLPKRLSYLSGDITAKAEKGCQTNMDHIHLSISCTYPHLVRWTGRGASGYHYPIGRVMVILDAADVLYPTKINGPMNSGSFTAWLADMKSAGLARSDAECARLLGLHVNSILAMKQKGADKRTALACRALLHRLEPYE